MNACTNRQTYLMKLSQSITALVNYLIVYVEDLKIFAHVLVYSLLLLNNIMGSNLFLHHYYNNIVWYERIISLICVSDRNIKYMLI